MNTTLDQLRPGERAKIKTIDAEGAMQQRILEMGLIPGMDVEVVRTAPLGDPIEVTVMSYHLSLRKSEAAFVAVERSQ